MVVRSRHVIGLACALSAVIATTAFPAPKNFHPDATISSLAGTRVLGDAKWKMASDEIVGTAGSGGGLLIGSPVQDAQMSASFRCTADCKPGVLLRVEQTPEGAKGVLVSLSPGDLAAYRVTLDKNGAVTARQPLEPAPGMRRFTTSITADNVLVLGPPAPPAAPRAGGGGRRGPTATVNPGGWNDVEIIVDENILRVNINGVDLLTADTGDATKGYGAAALYVEAGEARFKDVSYKDLGPKNWGPAHVAKGFHVQTLTPFSYSYSADVADINRDGVLDVVSGPYYYLGPKYTQQHEIYTPETLNPGTVAPIASRVQIAYDFTGDGWPDVLRIYPGGAMLYVNPGKESRRWEKFDTGVNVSTEIVLFKDIDGDGRPELIFGGGGAYGYAKPDPSNPTGKWIVHAVSQNIPVAVHGLGLGDVNNDGRMDLVAPAGWWEQPAKGADAGPWAFHPASLGNGGAEMCVYDVNGDGRKDVVTSLNAHGWGLAWFEQQADHSFAEHMIMGDFSTKNAGDVTFSELHGSACADIDGDGITDFVTGKRYWSHLENYSGPDPYGAPVLYAYETRRNARAPGGAAFVPEMLHNRSGVGSSMVVRDINGDGEVDIVTSTVLGVFIFWGEPSRAGRETHPSAVVPKRSGGNN